MGAGAVKGERSEPTTSGGQTSGQSDPSYDKSAVTMSCEQCHVNFTIFKRKKICLICRRHHCSDCLPKEPSRPSSQRRCTKCRQLSGNLGRAELMKFKVKDLKLYLSGRKVAAVEQCTEKNDLVELVLKSNNSAEYQRKQAESRQRVNELRSHLQEGLFSSGASDRSSGSSTPPTSQRQNDATSQRQNDATSPRPNDATSQRPSGDDTQRSSEATSQNANTSQGPDDVVTSQRPGENSSSTSNDAPSSRPSNSNTASANNTNPFGEANADRAEQLRERQAREMREAEERLRADWANDEAPDPRPSRKRTTLNDISREADIEEMTSKQLKEILVGNFVDYRGCCEKYELVERVTRLWNDTQKNQQKGADEGAVEGENELCKICMDALIDCVLLECGHMVTCTTCGRRLNECPICRSFVIRVVHTFKA